MIAPARTNLRLLQDYCAAMARVFFFVYLVAVAVLGVLRVYGRSVNGETLYWLRLVPLIFAISSVVGLTAAVWQRQITATGFGASSATSARLRAYGFVPVALALFVLPLYLADIG